jgi:16S rRNA (uracil1498-N3)-methyltransferase
MALPFFYTPQLHASPVVLDEATSKHIAGVLRMKVGEAVLLTNGNGTKAEAVIVDDNRKRCTVHVTAVITERERATHVSIAISLLKNAARFEWFLEKATEIGVAEIVPLLCERSERTAIRHDRMQTILISAMLQSQQCRLPVLHEPTKFDKLLQTARQDNRFIAHCLPQQKQSLYELLKNSKGSRLMLIGPEGDFTIGETERALQNGFLPVTLGDTRLRTETAGIVAAAWLCNVEAGS